MQKVDRLLTAYAPYRLTEYDGQTDGKALLIEERSVCNAR